MGFFSKIKQSMGIGGVKIQMAEPSVDPESGKVFGVVNVSSKSDLELLDLQLEVIETRTTGRGDDEEEEQFSLGTAKILLNEMIKAGEHKAVEYEVIYERKKSGVEALSEKGGALGALGKMGKFASKEEISFEITSVLDVKGVALDPTDSFELAEL